MPWLGRMGLGEMGLGEMGEHSYNLSCALKVHMEPNVIYYIILM